MENLQIIILASIAILFVLNIIYLKVLEDSLKEIKKRNNILSKSENENWLGKYYELKWQINSLTTWGGAIVIAGGIFGFNFYNQLSDDLKLATKRVDNLSIRLNTYGDSINILSDSINIAENKVSDLSTNANSVKVDLRKIKSDLAGTPEEVYSRFKLEDGRSIIKYLQKNPESAYQLNDKLYRTKFEVNDYNSFKELYKKVKLPDRNGTSLAQVVYAVILYKNFPYQVSKDIEIWQSVETPYIIQTFNSYATKEEVLNCLEGFLLAISESGGFRENERRVLDFTDYLSMYGLAVFHKEFKKAYFDSFYQTLNSFDTRRYLYEVSDTMNNTNKALTERLLRLHYRIDIGSLNIYEQRDTLNILIDTGG